MEQLARKPQWRSDSRRRRRTVVVDGTTGEPVELSRLSHPKWSERVVAKALAKQWGEEVGR